MMRTRVAILTTILIPLAAMLGTTWQTKAQDTKPEDAKKEEVKSPYPSMAPLEQYLIADRDAEIILARSAAPESISGDAEILVLGRRGFETAVKGKNGFVCFVQRSWSAGKDDPDFWNPKLRAPICLNPPAVRSYLPLTIKRTELILAGRSKEQMFAAIEGGITKKQLPRVESGAMCYMMSKQGHLSDRDGHWRPHLMFFTPLTEPAVWGADVPGSPIIAFKDTSEQMTVFLVPVEKWSDGTPAGDER
jgi:hypothetical protein